MWWESSMHLVLQTGTFPLLLPVSQQDKFYTNVWAAREKLKVHQALQETDKQAGTDVLSSPEFLRGQNCTSYQKEILHMPFHTAVSFLKLSRSELLHQVLTSACCLMYNFAPCLFLAGSKP